MTKQVTERHMNWYAVWRALSFTKTYTQVTSGGDPDSRQVCRLLDIAQYLARLNSIAVSEDGVDAGLVETEDIIDAQTLQFLLENIDDVLDALESVETVDSFDKVEIED